MEDALHGRVDAAVSDEQARLGMGQDLLLGHRLGDLGEHAHMTSRSAKFLDRPVGKIT